MTNKRICPKCFNRNTEKASKLGMYEGAYFCKDCAIYYNKFVSVSEVRT